MQISQSLSYSSKYSEKRGISFKLVDVDGVTEITAKELVFKYFNNPEDYFIVFPRQTRMIKQWRIRGRIVMRIIQGMIGNNNNMIKIEADKRNNKHHKNTDNNNCQGKEQLEERF